MAGDATETRARARAGLRLTTILIAVIVLVGAVVAVVVARRVTTQRSTPAATPAVPAAPSSADAVSAVGAVGATAEEQELASRPMLRLPAQAAQPQAMTTASAGAAIAVPAPSIAEGRWIPGGFPDTVEGALGQLTALNTTALAAADPQVYATGYREASEQGAPDAASTGLASLLRSMRSRAGLPDTGSVAGLTASFQITHGQIKGTASGGRFVVACVLGQFSVAVDGQVTSAGVGDCQAMRWNGTEWRIASGALAAAAPCAWPGSADAVKAGYRELR